MKLHLPRVCLVGLASGVCSVAFAQSDIPIEYLKPLNNSFSFGVRMTGHGVKVKFGNLGTVPGNPIDIPGADGVTTATRAYDDGAVLIDAQRANEPGVVTNVTDATTGDVTPTTSTSVLVGNGRYRTVGASNRIDSAGNDTTPVDDTGTAVPVATYTGEFNLFVAGQTREWAYTNDSQATERPGSIAMHTYSSTSDGATAEGEGGVGGGIEMELGHTFGRIGNRMEWGVTFTFGMNDINVKTSSVIKASLHTITDYYTLPDGVAAPGAGYNSISQANATDFNNVYQDTGDQVYSVDATTDPITVTPLTTSLGNENATYLNTPDAGNDPSVANGNETITNQAGMAQIIGHWQIKGAYYMAKLGPSLRFTISPKFAISASGGFAMALVSSKFHVDEQLVLPNLTQTIPITADSLVEQKLKPGYFANLNAEYWVTPRTGFYGGATYEKVGAYDQEFLGRTAHIDVGGGLGFRLGMITRF